MSWFAPYSSDGALLELRGGRGLAGARLADGIDWTSAPFDVEQFRMGMNVELEHGFQNLVTNVSHDDPVVTGKIALAQLNAFPDYSRLSETCGQPGMAFSSHGRRKWH